MPCRPCNVLMIYPRFSPLSFWNYQATCKVVGARYSAAPLGMITVAALLPPEWTVRLVNRNTEEVRETDLVWADLVMTGGMLPQQLDTLRVVEMAHASGTPVVVGGPDVTADPDAYAIAEFRVLGEAEEIMGDLVAAWESGAGGGIFRAESFPDITRSPIPRFDLLKLEQYMHVGVQISRGCPFSCEFCNVIELNGRVPRTKTSAQALTELSTLYNLGYRGHVDFVDDNLIGNRKLIKSFLADLARWLERHGHPFEFSTEASINVADDPELLNLLKEANFFALFVGIETSDTASLLGAGKKQNAGKDITASVRRIYEAGLFVNAGFIVGFDDETSGVARAMIACIEEAAIPVCMVGLLYALPGTSLWKRLKGEARLHAETGLDELYADQCSAGLNFTTLRPRREVLEDYRTVLRTIYEPRAFFGRVDRAVRGLDLSRRKTRRPLRSLLRDLRSLIRIGWRSGVLDAPVRGPFWRALRDCMLRNPRGLRTVVSFAALYLHLRPFAGFMDERMAERIRSVDEHGNEPRTAAVRRALTPLLEMTRRRTASGS